MVNVAIMARVYTDQSILLKDLIYPNEGLLVTSKKFKELKAKLNINESTFSTAFWLGANKLNDSQFLSFLASIRPNVEENSSASKNGRKMSLSNSIAAPNKPLVGEESSNNEEISIYFPYEEAYINEFDNSNNYSPTTSVMTATADADEGYGWQPTFDSGGAINGYNQVVITDDYAVINPTHIIGINGIEATSPDFNDILVFEPSTPIVVPGLPREVKQVYVGEVICKKQYDHFVSFTGNGGGSEIRFTRSDGYLKVADGHVQADHFVVNGKDAISRYNIRNERWVDWTVQWDADWESDNEEQNLAIYEEDNRNTVSATVSLSTKVKIYGQEVTGTIGGTFTFKSDDAIIRQQNHKYDIFSALNRGYAGEPTRSGWLVYDNGGLVSFTLPERTLTP